MPENSSSSADDSDINNNNSTSTSCNDNDNNKGNNKKISRRDFLKLLGYGTIAATFGMFNKSVFASNIIQQISSKPIVPVPLVAQGREGILGKWDIYGEKPSILPIHAALLRTGKVLFIGGSQHDLINLQCNLFGDVLWDPTAPPSPSAFKELFHPPNLHPSTDIFCGGHSFLEDGKLLIVGGTKTLDPLFEGTINGYLFNPTPQEKYEPTHHHMKYKRWYPTLVSLADKRVFIISGYSKAPEMSNIPEIYETSKVDDSNRFFELTYLPTHNPSMPKWPTYPHIFLLANGHLFYTGGHVFAANDRLPPGFIFLDINGVHKTYSYSSLPSGTYRADLLRRRDQGCSVLLPPAHEQKIMILGGGRHAKDLNDPIDTKAINNVEIIDLSHVHEGVVRFIDAAPLIFPRIYPNAITLPDRTVLVCGGNVALEEKFLDHEKPRDKQTQPPHQNTAEIYNPTTNRWYRAATASVWRAYHSLAVLLPDGRVVTAGSNPERRRPLPQELVCPNSPVIPEDISIRRGNEYRLEIYSPPYLFYGNRPTITRISDDELIYNGQMDVYSPDVNNISWIHIIRPMATTHSSDTEQRLVDVPFTHQISSNNNNTGELVARCKITNNPNLAPPGWYMLFITRPLSNNGIPRAVPSVAKWVHLAGTKFEMKWGSFGTGNGQFDIPIGIAIVPAIDFVFVYVSDILNNTIQKFVRDSTFISKIGPLVSNSNGTITEGMSRPIGIAVDSKHNLYICDSASHRILKFDSSGRLLTKWGSFGTGDGQFNSPWGIAMDSSDNVYVTSNSFSIQVFDSNGNYIRRWGEFGDGPGQFSLPRSIAIDKSESDIIYIGDIVNQRIQAFTKDEMVIRDRIWGSSGTGDGQFRQSRGIAVDSSGPNGRVYVADSFNHRIQVFTKKGKFIRKWGSLGNGDGQFSSPEGIAVDSANNVYVADLSNHRIQVFSSVENVFT